MLNRCSDQPNLAVVDFQHGGWDRTIDFMRVTAGVKINEELVDTAIPVQVDERITFLVMHPIHCMESRAANVASIPGYDTPHALRQMRAACVCLREYLKDILDGIAYPGEQDVRVRDVLDLNKRIFRFSRDNQNARRVFRLHNIDTFDAVCTDSRLPEAFHREAYPRWRSQLAKSRSREIDD